MRVPLVASVTLASFVFAGGCGGDDQPDRRGPAGDYDGDGITNADEDFDSSENADLDDFPDFRDLDSDEDALPDAAEAGDEDLTTHPIDSDDDGLADFRDTDSDNDAIRDDWELGDDWQPVDSDDDGTPDHLDADSDGDTIGDVDEHDGDYDQDGTPNFRDLDMDGDGIDDAIEAGDDDLATAPRDTDGDRVADFRDLDSDDDGISDEDEDPNGNGQVDDGESSAIDADTDDDGTPDLVERVAGTDPNDAGDDIPVEDFFFVLPYEGPLQTGTLAFSTDVRRSDIFFSVDTTGSFGEEIAEIQDTIEGAIIPGVGAVIPDAAYGVARFEDFPIEPYGLAGDRPFQLLQAVTEDVALVAAGVDALPPAAGGLDTPEAGVEALYQWATGAGFDAFGYPAFSSGIGGAGFRQDSLPIIIQITDARSHSPEEYGPFALEAHSREEAIEVLRAISARVIGIRSVENDASEDDPREELEALAIASNALVPPVAGGCATGIDGAVRAPVDVAGEQLCPLVFDVRTDGSGLGGLIVEAISELAAFGTLDISARAVGTRDRSDPHRVDYLAEGTTTADFIDAIVPVPPAPDGAEIVGDVFVGVRAGSAVEFELQARNDFVPELPQVQLFTLEIEVVGDGVTVLDGRRVYVIVPPAIPEPVIE